jgi:prophage regulatory protein
MEILRKKAVLARTGLSKTTLHRRVVSGNFPRPIPLGSPRTVGWLASEVDAWIEEQVKAAREDVAKAS